MRAIISRAAFLAALAESHWGVAQGVRDVFGIVGSAYMDALDIFPAAGIRFIPVAHEQGAVHAAEIDGELRAEVVDSKDARFSGTLAVRASA